MSQYNVMTVAINPQLIAACQQFFTTKGSWVGSHELLAATTPLLELAPRDLLLTRSRRLSTIAGAESLLARISGPTVKEYTELRLASDRAAGSGKTDHAQVLARRANCLLDHAVRQAVPALQRQERQVTLTAASNALGALGYALTQSDGDRASALVAERDNHLFAVLIEDGGRLQVDIAGLAAGGCEVPLREFHAALAREGLTSTITSVTHHDDHHGGGLIKRAAAAAPDHLARGLVQQHEQGAVRRRNREIITGTAATHVHGGGR